MYKLGEGSPQTEQQQRASGAYCAGQGEQTGPTHYPPNTPWGPEVYAYYRQANTQCPVNLNP